MNRPLEEYMAHYSVSQVEMAAKLGKKRQWIAELLTRGNVYVAYNVKKPDDITRVWSEKDVWRKAA